METTKERGRINIFLQSGIGKIVLALILFGLGFLSGMEYKAYQVRSALGEALDVFNTDEPEETVKEEKSPASNDLNKKVNLTVEKKSFSSSDWEDEISLTFKFTNNSGKDIEGVQGTVYFSDLFGNSVKYVRISYDEGIKAGEIRLYTGGLDYNQFMDEDEMLRKTDLSKLKYEWDADTIIYTDGSQETK